MSHLSIPRMLGRPPLSLALASLRSPSAAGDPRAPLEWAAATGFRWITLDASAPGLRPRELGRSARRDLAALLRRLELGLMGIDLWIPTAHFTDPVHADRAVSAATGAIGLSADLASLNGGEGIVSLTLPRDDLPHTVRDTLLTHADARQTLLADHTWPPREADSDKSLGVGFDPAVVLLAGDNPAKAAARLGERIVLARLSDASEVSRVEPGSSQGRLNDLAYTVALDTAKYARPLVLDTRGLGSPADAADRTLAWWTAS